MTLTGEHGRESSDTTLFYLPRTMDAWPWPRQINPHFEEVQAQSDAWFSTFNAFSDRSQHAFNVCDFGRLAALAYPHASKEHLRTGCDLMNLFFVLDEYTDVEPAHAVRAIIDAVIDALHHPHKSRPEGEIFLGQLAKEFWSLAVETASLSSQKHFLESFTDYLNSVVKQAEDRDNRKILSIDEYLATRRQNIGIRPSFVPGELHLTLPDAAFYHPVVKELEYLVADLIIIDNDIASYNKEQASGDDLYNILTVAMHQFRFGLDKALAWANDYHKEVERQFIDALGRVPSFGFGIDGQLQQYLQHIAGWPRGNDCWSFESGRYFGEKGREIQVTRLVPLLPQIGAERTQCLQT